MEPEKTVPLAERVRACFYLSLYLPEELEQSQQLGHATQVNGITMHVNFHPQRLLSQQLRVYDLLREMPETFHAHQGGGGSFLNLCVDRHGAQWGEHADIEMLCLLAIGLNIGKWCFPREMWEALPGGLPYVVFDL